MDEIKSYIYLDEEAVNSIYAQLRKKIIAKKTIKRIKGKAASFKIGAGLSKLFSIFSGDASANKERSYSTQTEIEYLMLPEDRVDPIIEVLAKGKRYYTELEKAIESLNKEEGSVFINVYDSFSADKSIPENAGYTAFERRIQTVSDTGVKRDKVIMAMSDSKLKYAAGSNKLHLKMALKAGENDMLLGVFGQLRKIKDGCYQIKPIAVWW
jgi:hypothetical protein